MTAGGTIGTWSTLALLASSATAQVDQQRAQEFFKEAQALCERDGGRLWGVSLCGPMVIADRRTQTLATSHRSPKQVTWCLAELWTGSR